MPFKLSFRHGADRHATVPPSDTASPSAKELKLQRFGEKLLKWSAERSLERSGKPVDFDNLAKLHKAWQDAGKTGSDASARTVLALAERYLHWAEAQQAKRLERQRPASNKLSDRRRQAAAMVAKAEEALATRPPVRTTTSAARTASPTRSRSPSPTSSSTGSTRSSQSPRPAGSRLGNAADAAVKSFRQQFNRPKPGSAREFLCTFEAWVKKLNTQPFDEVEALQVLRMGRRYLERRGNTVSKDQRERVRHKYIARYTEEVEKHIKENRLQRNRGVDTACARLHSPDLGQRTRDRQRHAAGMVAQLPTLNVARDSTSERFIVRADGTRMYHFVPMPTRAAANGDDVGPQHAVLASVLHRKLVEQVGLDLRFPCATPAMIEGAVGVLVDVVDLPSPRPAPSAHPKGELQRAVLAQWVLGRPRARWSDVGVDEQGLLRPRRLPCEAFAPSEIGLEGLKGVSPMINTDDPIQELHSPIDVDLAARLLRLDIDALAKSMGCEQDVIDMQTHGNGLQARQAPRSLMASHKDAVNRLLEPLRALQSALRSAMKARVALPLAMVLADAAEDLSQANYP